MSNIKVVAYSILTLAIFTICCKAIESDEDSEDNELDSQRRFIVQELIRKFSKRQSACTDPKNRYDIYCSGTGSGACGKTYKYGCVQASTGAGCYCDNVCTTTGCPVPSTNACTGTGKTCYPNAAPTSMYNCCKGVCCGTTNINSVCCNPGEQCCSRWYTIVRTCKPSC
ncbi:unnamed protein product [Adineta steineri]|uniref:Uncharacterized protein n=1 Tax=Adineta steineri TaxID=433720 RepID=A0A814PD38_9BILA|nr:unnamed protein product [Adineta steineri]CAF1104033.1 unnamed protein product [Adineta steineri]